MGKILVVLGYSAGGTTTAKYGSEEEAKEAFEREKEYEPDLTWEEFAKDAALSELAWAGDSSVEVDDYINPDEFPNDAALGAYIRQRMNE